MRLIDKVAFITGAGSGVGRATALIFAKEGAKIIAADVDPNAGNETVDIVKHQGGDAVFVLCDVAVEADVKKAVTTGVAAFGRLNILYNNAGVLWRDQNLEVTRTDETTWDRVMAININCRGGVYPRPVFPAKNASGGDKPRPYECAG